MAETVYLLCTLASLACALLLARSYRKQRTRLLMWSTLCFTGLAINNVLMFIDLVVVPSMDMSLARAATALCSVGLLVIGLLWEDS